MTATRASSCRMESRRRWCRSPICCRTNTAGDPNGELEPGTQTGFGRAPRGRCGRGLAASAATFRVHRPGAGAQQSRRLHRRRTGAQGSARSRAVCRSARPRQNHAGADRGARACRQFPRHVGPGDRQGRRSRGAADQSRRARRALHRRNSPAQSGGRGNSLSGDGGFPARSHHRRGAGGALGEDRSRQIHADRRHHPGRAPDQSAARPLRHSGPAQFLFRGGAGADRQSRRARARHRL